MNEIVKYHNKLNNITFRDFLASDCDYFMYLCSKFKYKGEETIVFTFREIKEAIGMPNESNIRVEEALLSMNSKLLRTTGLLRDGNITKQFVLFIEFETDKDNQTLTVTVNKKYSYLLNEFSEGFTRFDFQEFMLLSSKYSKTLYRLLKQWRTKGEYVVSIEDLKKYIDCPENMENRYFMRDVVKKSIKELSEKECFKNLTVTSSRGKAHGGPLSTLTFTFKKEKAKDDEGEGKKLEQKPVKPSGKEKRPREPRKPDPTNKFNNFDQRQYDYDDLERKLLQ